MAGTWPSSPGFGRPALDGSPAMQRQPEPSDGRPKVPDACSRKYHSPQQSKRGKTRFRDDRSRRHRGANSNRHNVKKLDSSLSRCDPFGIRKDSPSKSFANLNLPNKSDKGKHVSVKNEYDSLKVKPIDNISTENVQNPLEGNSGKTVCAQRLFVETPLLGRVVENAENTQIDVHKDGVEPIQADVEMKPIDEIKTENVHMKDLSVDEESAGSSANEIGDNVDDLYVTLREYLQVESKFQPLILLPAVPQRGEISAGTRDGAVHVLRCLKVWYDLPTDVLFHAINLLDRFLTKMKVRLCHMSCISVSCMHIAILSHNPKLPPINTDDLVLISQCKCTAGDVRRMSAIIEQKLGVVGEVISPLHWLRLLLKLLKWAAVNLLDLSNQFLVNILQEPDINNRLEILLCDASCCNIRSCELALVLICTQLDNKLRTMQSSNHQSDQVNNLMQIIQFAMELQRVCQIADDSFNASHQAVISVLERYNKRQKTPHRQCLVWKLSSRTLKVLRPTDKLTSMLPTIQEQQFSGNSPLKKSIVGRSRLSSESSDDLNEDTKDWPTSPVVPVLCNNN